MAKVKRGLPDGFNLGVNVGSPAILGDFLDETAKSAPISTVPTRNNDPVHNEPPTIQQSPSMGVGNTALSLERFDEGLAPAASPSSPPPRVVALQRNAYAKPPRFELSLNHETKRMVQELLNYIQTMGPQPAAKASEMFQGIISVLYRAKGSLDLSHLPRRGQWGSPTARAFPIALGEAFAKAIAEQQRIEASKRRL